MDTLELSMADAVVLPCDLLDQWTLDDLYAGQAPEYPVSLLEEAYLGKPSDSEYKSICKRIGHHPILVGVEALARLVTAPTGYPWCAGIYDLFRTGSKKNGESWICQHFFALDIDHDPDDPDVFTWQMALNRCKEYDLYPCIIYSTFSAIGEERYRLVFLVEVEVRDERIRNVINRLLLEMFPEADQRTKDAARVITGGRKLLYLNENARLDVEHLVRSFHTYSFGKDKKNYARFIDKIGAELCLNVLPSKVLDIRFVESEDMGDGSPVMEGIEMGETYYDGSKTIELRNWRWDNKILLDHHSGAASI